MTATTFTVRFDPLICGLILIVARCIPRAILRGCVGSADSQIAGVCFRAGLHDVRVRPDRSHGLHRTVRDDALHPVSSHLRLMRDQMESMCVSALMRDRGALSGGGLGSAPR